MLEEKYLKIVKSIINKHLDTSKYKVFIFGSRADGTDRKFSDIDIGIEGKAPIDTMTKINLEEEFEYSDLPYHVDVVDMNKSSKRFKQVATKITIPLN